VSKEELNGEILEGKVFLNKCLDRYKIANNQLYTWNTEHKRWIKFRADINFYFQDFKIEPGKEQTVTMTKKQFIKRHNKFYYICPIVPERMESLTRVMGFD